MDCRMAKENIWLYLDGFLDGAQKKDFEEHVQNCPACRKDLDDALRLKTALAAMGELEPPAGLARSAVRKARKRRIPPFAYITAAMAAAIALIVVLTSSIFPLRQDLTKVVQDSQRSMVAASQAAADQQLCAEGDSETGDADESAAAEEAPESSAEAEETLTVEMAPAPNEANAATEVPARMDSAAGDIQGGDQFAIQGSDDVCVVTVPEESSFDIRTELGTIIAENEIEATTEDTGDVETISFVVPEAALKELTELTADLPIDGEIAVGGMIEFSFAK